MTVRVFATIGSILSIFIVFAQEQIPNSVYENATRSFEEGRAAEAEATLNSVLRDHPRDVRALSLMGVILDSNERYAAAEGFYRRALEIAPNSTALLNNLGNHYLAAGNPKMAAGLFRRVLALDAHHANANLHLAEMSLAEKHGAEALAFLNRLPASEQAQPVAHLLRGQALALRGQCEAAAGLLASLEHGAGGDSRFSFSIGLAYAACKRYEQAENSFTRALQSDPKNFDFLYNLGLVARHAGHLDRAQQVFEIALQQRPEEPDALYALAEVLADAGNKVMATALLYRAHRLAPDRPDILLLLAHITEELGYYEETAISYGQYLKLRPRDDVVRRELGFSLARAGKFKDALPELQWFARNHPKDPIGQYELAIAEAFTDPTRALERFDRALALDPSLLQARYARAVLNFQEEKPARSVEDFRFLSQRDPKNIRLLDWLAQVFLRLDQAQEAEVVLKQAIDLAPSDPAVLIHYSKTLRKLGRNEESAKALATFKQVALTQPERRPHKGLFDFLDLSPEQQRARYLEYLEAANGANPQDASLKARWAKALIEQGRVAEAAGVFREVLALAPDAEMLADCGRTLLHSEQYALAAEFLRSVPDARLDLAIAVFHATNPEAGLSELERIPAAERHGDYYLLRAQILDAMGKLEQAADSLNRGICAAPTRADMYFQAAVFLIKHSHREEAVRLLADATRLLPDASELLLARAIALELLQHTDDALKLLARIESRWPEWDRPYLINGIILENELKSAEAEQMLDTAIALGAHDADVYYYQTLAISHATPDNLEDAQKAISQALALNAEDPSIRLLAGEILLKRKDYAAALDHLTAAVRLQPTSVRAHYLLRAAYRDLGDAEKSAAELQQIERITRDNPDPDRTPSPMQRLLFAVRPPDRSVSPQ